MSLQSLLSFLNIVPGSADAAFTASVQEVIALIYQGSTTIRADLDARVLSGNPLNIVYAPGQMNNVSIDGAGISSDIIQIDPTYCDDHVSINQFGDVHQRGFTYMLVHELCHALYETSDPEIGDLNEAGFDFVGDNVRRENEILEEMGLTDRRVGYFSTFKEDVDRLASYTAGAEIDYAYKNSVRSAIVDASQSMQKDLDGLLVGSSTSEAIVGGNGSDFLWGLDSADAINGGSGDDKLFGGRGVDQLFGESDDDLIFFDSSDFVSGGTGRDAAWVVEGSVEANLGTMELEVLVGGGGSDMISAGSSVQTVMIAGGGGDDVITIDHGDGQGPRVVWGGAGADTFLFKQPEYGEGEAFQCGILVASVSGLTERNFHLFDHETMLGLQNIDWSKIDVIVLNPDSSDTVVVSWYTPETADDIYYGVVGFDEYGEIYDAVPGTAMTTAIAGQSSALGSQMLIQSPENDEIAAVWYRYGENNYSSMLNGNEVASEEIDDALDELGVLGAPVATWTVDFSNVDGGEGGDGEGKFWRTFEAGSAGYDPDADDPWFVAGGKFVDGKLVEYGAPVATMDPNAGISSDWLVA